MSFLAPAALALSALLPVILLLYFLKLKRRQELISSTYLWQRAIEDLRVNSPLQRLRKNLLLWLQLALLALLVAALSRPAFRGSPREGRRYIALIDTSASMAATDVSPSRLAAAKRRALALVNDLSRGDRMMLMTFDVTPAVVVPFTDSKSRLREAIRGLEARETATDFGQAVELMRGLAEASPDVHVFLFSDGAFAAAAGAQAPAVEFSYVRIGEKSANLGITAVGARRSLDDWDQPQIFARVDNFGETDVAARLDLYLNDKLFSAKVVNAPAGDSAAAVFTDPQLTDGVVKIVLATNEPDHLAVDDQAWLALTAPRKARVLVVTPGNYFLEIALQNDPLCAPVYVKPPAFEKDLAAGTLVVGEYDLTIFDRHAPKTLPAGSHLFLGVLPPLENFRSEGTAKTPVVIDWDALHPVNEHVNYANLFLAETLKVTVPPDARILVESDAGPLVVGWTSPAHRLVVVAFDTFASRWPLRPAFPIFLANAVRYLGGVQLTGGAARIQPGKPIIFDVPQEVGRVRVTRPNGTEADATVQSGRVTFGDTYACGPYVFDLGRGRRRTFAVNLTDARESDLATSETIEWQKTTVTGTSRALKENREIWSWLALVALGLLMVEWYVYNRRVYL